MAPRTAFGGFSQDQESDRVGPVQTESEIEAAILQWHLDMGVDDITAPDPIGLYNWAAERSPLQQKTPAKQTALKQSGPTSIKPAEPSATADEQIAAAKAAANACHDFEAIAAAVEAFKGCPLRQGASRTVFADGAIGADLLVIGEAPGREEDRLGKPFVGRAGQLLDRMLAAIGRSRSENALISNVVYWRPPGNRTPTQIETAICRPFVDRLIDITKPKAILLAGGAPLQALLGVTGIMRARGAWRDIETASGARYPALPIFHPAFLLRQPAQKRLAWSDLQNLQARLTDS